MKVRFSKFEARLFAAGLLGFVLVAVLVQTGNTGSMDVWMQNYAVSMRSEWLTRILVPFSYTGNWQAVTAVCAVLLILPRTRTAYGVPLSASAVLCVAVYEFLKHAFRRPRPDAALHLLAQGGYSFPSGHSLTSMVVWGMLILLIGYYYGSGGRQLPIYGKKYGEAPYFKEIRSVRIAMTILGLYIFFMGFSRIYVGVHWASDVLASWLLALPVMVIIKNVFFYRRDDR